MFGGGIGTQEDPFIISEFQHLLDIATIAENPPIPIIYFKQTEDIDMSPTETMNDNGDGTYAGWAPVVNNTFSLRYDGGGHKISNMYINRPEESGLSLFGNSPDIQVKNLTMENCTIIGKDNLACIANDIYPMEEAGLGFFEDCHIVNATITATEGNIGGVCRYFMGERITGCSATGINFIFGDGGVGGIVGGADNISITDCTASGSITSEGGDSHIGGIIGILNNWEGQKTMEQCSANVTINTPGASDVGGLIGYIFSGNGDDATVISNCHATGDVVGRSSVGGLIGSAGAKLKNCYATGNVAGADEAERNASKIGGLIGESYCDYIEDCHASGDVRGYKEVGGLVGSIGQDSEDIRRCYATGNVTTRATGNDDAYAGGLIGNMDSGISVEDCYATGNIEVTDSAEVGGLVGYGSGAIKRCHATGNISRAGAKGDGVGGIIGNSYSILIEDCFYDGSIDVSGGEKGSMPQGVGGIAGHFGGDSSVIRRCHSMGNIKGDWAVGGIVGYGYQANIVDSLAMANVEAVIDCAAGLIAFHGGPPSEVEGIARCLVVGQIKTNGEEIGGICAFNGGIPEENWPITSTFFNIETTGVSVSAGSESAGRSSEELTKRSTYEGWDFDNTWTISEYSKMPALTKVVEEIGDPYEGNPQFKYISPDSGPYTPSLIPTMTPELAP